MLVVQMGHGQGRSWHDIGLVPLNIPASVDELIAGVVWTHVLTPFEQRFINT